MPKTKMLLPGVLVTPVPMMDSGVIATPAPGWPAGAGGYSTRVQKSATSVPLSYGEFYMLEGATATTPFTVTGGEAVVIVGRTLKGKLTGHAIEGMYATPAFVDPLAALNTHVVASYAAFSNLIKLGIGTHLAGRAGAIAPVLPTPVLTGLVAGPLLASMVATAAEAGQGARATKAAWALRIEEHIEVLSGGVTLLEAQLPVLKISSDEPWPSSVAIGPDGFSELWESRLIRLAEGQYDLRITFSWSASALAMGPFTPYLVMLQAASAALDVTLETIPHVRIKPKGGNF